ncbi:MAG TPA: hypothetical protein VI168_03065 [Croceibacterium sp.]
MSSVTAGSLALSAIVTPVSAASAQTAVTTRDLNAALDSIVETDSQGWWVNDYDSGSMTDAAVTQVSDDGRAYVVRGNYTYNGGSGGYVDALVRDNQLVCLQFWDTSSCRAMRTEPAPYAEAALAGITLATLAALASGPSGGSYASGGGSDSYDDYYRQRPYQTEPERPAYEDTSIGCAWGDRATGTCH